MANKNVLILGGAGQVGQMLLRSDWPGGTQLHAPGRATVDLSVPADITKCVAMRNWDLVINAAAYTAVDKAEVDVESAWILNAVAPSLLAHEAAKTGIPIIHISTDYVFDGTKDGSYLEDDAVAPTSVYGASKEGGEQGVRAGNERHVILRTAWVYGPDRANFLKTMLRVGKDRSELAVVADQIGCPTSTQEIAHGILTIAKAIWLGKTLWGTYHLTGAGEASWYDFAEQVFHTASKHWPSPPKVRPITTAEYPTPATRPSNSRLDCSKLERDYGHRSQPWKIDVTKTVNMLIESENEEGTCI